MSIFSKLFGGQGVVKNQEVEIYSPIDGEVIDLSEVPDEAFACGAIGDGVAIVPSEDDETIYAPVNADEVNIFETNHAVSFETRDGLEVIVHFGVDTVQLKGNGFERIGKEGPAKVGDKIVKYDLKYLESNAKSTKTPVLISNMDIVENIEKSSGKVKAGDLLMKVKLKPFKK